MIVDEVACGGVNVGIRNYGFARRWRNVRDSGHLVVEAQVEVCWRLAIVPQLLSIFGNQSNLSGPTLQRLADDDPSTH